MGGQINEDGQMDKKRSWDGEMKGSRKRERKNQVLKGRGKYLLSIYLLRKMFKK